MPESDNEWLVRRFFQYSERLLFQGDSTALPAPLWLITYMRAQNLFYGAPTWSEEFQKPVIDGDIITVEFHFTWLGSRDKGDECRLHFLIRGRLQKCRTSSHLDEMEVLDIEILNLGEWMARIY